MKRFFLLLLLTLNIIACNSQDDPFERIQKLRGLGVSTAPSSLAPSGQSGQKFTLTLYAAVPLGQNVTIEPAVDEASKYAQSVPVTVVAGSEVYKDFAQLRLFEARLSLEVPAISEESIPKDSGFLPLRYAVLLRSGDEEEKIVGNVLLYPSNSAKLQWKAPTAEITAPKSGESIENKNKIELKANILHSNEGDNIRIGWFVTSGNVLKRRASEAIWEKAASGSQTVILTVRGLKSGAMAAPLVLDVNL